MKIAVLSSGARAERPGPHRLPRRTYYLFDFNPKPNLTGAARPHRMNQNCLTMISAAAQGWSYFDLLHKMSESRRQL